MSQTAFTGSAELEKEYEAYMNAFTCNPVDYPAIVTSLLEIADGMVFITVIAGNQF